MSHRKSHSVPLSAALAALSIVGGSMIIAHGASIVSIKTFVDDFGSSGLVDIQVSAPVHSQVTLQAEDVLNSSGWKDVSAPTLIQGSNPVTFSVPTTFSDGKTPVPHRFFRFLVESFRVDVKDDGSSVNLQVGAPIPASVLFQTLSAKTGFSLFGSNDTSITRTLPAFTGTGANLEDALGSAGLRMWTLGPAKDEPVFAQRGLIPIKPQLKRLADAPGDVGVGRIEAGFEGIPNMPKPISLLRPIPPSPNNDKGLKLEVVDTLDVNQILNPDVREQGRHLQFTFSLGVNGGLKPTAAYSLTGSPILNRRFLAEEDVPVDPPAGSIIYVVRSKKATSFGASGIFHIGVQSDPFEARAYQPPFRGAHGSVPLAREDIRLQIPVLDNDQDLAGMTVEVYRYVKPARLGWLTPATFEKNIDRFQQLGQIGGDQLNRLVALTPKVGFGLQDVELAGVTRAATLTQLHSSGSRATKFNMVIIAEGFADTEADQKTFNDYVDATVMQDLLQRDIHPEILNAMNIFRINTYSKQSGVTRVNSSGTVTSTKDTALGYRFSGDWNRCWMEPGPGTTAAIDAIVNALIPEANVKAIVLNTTSFGGCSRGHHFAVTRGSDWSVYAHEFGHFFGGLGDEYQCNSGDSGCGWYSGGEPDAGNLTKTTTRASIEWNDWIPATRPVPTALANVVDTTQDAGLFPGATIGNGQWWNGIYRPSWRGRMNNNSTLHNPIGYTSIRNNARLRQDGDFRKSVSGDFNGDGRTDLVLIDDRQLSLYLATDRKVGPNDPVTGAAPRPVTGVLEPTWYHTDILYNASKTKSWEFRGSDILIPADFDGDGKTDLYVVNLKDWVKPYVCMLRSTGKGFEPVRRFDLELPGWGEMRGGDEFYAGDFTGDGKADLMVFNGTDWSMPYFLMLRSTGVDLAYSHRYDRYLPVWEMGRHEKFFVGDFDGDGRKEVISQNTQDWNQVQLMVFRSTGAQLSLTDRFYGEIRINNGLFWTMRRQDELFLPNFDGNKTTDLAIFNGRDWTPEYLGLFALVDGKLNFRHRYEGSVPGWDLSRRDRFYVADVNGDGNQDLVVYNSKNWSTQYLGILKSKGDGSLAGSWQDDWIGSWNLSDGDDFHVADFRGAAGWDDLFVFNKNWFGLLRSYSTRYQLEAIYPKWIHNHRYNANGWW